MPTVVARTAAVLCGLLLLLAWALRVCLAQESVAAGSAIELIVEPATLEVPRHGTPARAIVVARRADPAATEGLELSFVATSGLQVDVERLAGTSGDVAWVASLVADMEAPDQGVVEFRLSYTTPPAADAPPPPAGVERTRLAVTAVPGRDSSPLDDVELSLKFDFESVSDVVAGKAYLIATNKSRYASTIKLVDVHVPAFLAAALTLEKQRLAPFATLVVPFDISVKQRAPIGEWLILARVAVSRDVDADGRDAIAAVESKIKVGVPGVSEVLQVLDLPSLLLIPGALVLATWSLLLGATKPGWLEWKSSSFWVIAITLSIAVFVGLRWSGIGTDYLVAFNVADAAWLWIGCVVGAAVVGVLYLAGRWAVLRYIAWQAEQERRRREPLPGDQPIDILRKLRRANEPFYLASYSRGPAGNEQQIFRLGLAPAEGATWAVPRMLLTLKAKHKEAADLAKAIEAANNDPRTGFPVLLAALEQGLQKDWISLDWETAELTRPERLADDQLGRLAPQKASPVAV